MTPRTKNINLFLLDGTASGRIKCTLSNWTGLVYKIPRTDLDLCSSIPAFNQSGVYFLFGTDDTTGEQYVYVGQASNRKNGEGILSRLREHKRNPEKDYWTEVIIFTTSANTMGPTEISYLENKFCEIASTAERYIVKNGNSPSLGNVSEEKESELNEFIDYAKIVMGALGHKVFEPISNRPMVPPAGAPESSLDLNSSLLYFSNSKSNATGYRTQEGFVVSKGSKISNALVPSCPDIIKRLRKEHAAKINSDGILQSDLLLTSPSTAAGFVSGSSQNGNVVWRTKDGKALKEVEAAEE